MIYAEETRKRREEETEDSREETPITPDLVGATCVPGDRRASVHCVLVRQCLRARACLRAELQVGSVLSGMDASMRTTGRQRAQ